MGSQHKSFQQQVQKLADAMKALGNPFQRALAELVNIETGDCASEEVTKHWSLSRVWVRINIVKNVIEDRIVSIHETIKKNSLPLFKPQNPSLKQD